MHISRATLIHGIKCFFTLCTFHGPPLACGQCLHVATDASALKRWTIFAVSFCNVFCGMPCWQYGACICRRLAHTMANQFIVLPVSMSIYTLLSFRFFSHCLHEYYSVLFWGMPSTGWLKLICPSVKFAVLHIWRCFVACTCGARHKCMHAFPMCNMPSHQSKHKITIILIDLDQGPHSACTELLHNMAS